MRNEDLQVFRMVIIHMVWHCTSRCHLYCCVNDRHAMYPQPTIFLFFFLLWGRKYDHGELVLCCFMRRGPYVNMWCQRFLFFSNCIMLFFLFIVCYQKNYQVVAESSHQAIIKIYSNGWIYLGHLVVMADPPCSLELLQSVMLSVVLGIGCGVYEQNHHRA